MVELLGNNDLENDALFKVMQTDLDKILMKSVCDELKITNNSNQSEIKAMKLECNKRKKS